MARKPLRSQLNQIRAWVRQGRTDAWIAHQLEVPTSELREFVRRHDLSADGEPDADADLRDEIEAEIEATMSEDEEDEEEDEEDEDEDEGDEEEGKGQGGEDAGEDSNGDGAPKRRRRRRGGRRRGAKRVGAGMQASFDHGDADGYGLWMDPAIADDPVYSEHWAGHREIEVTIEPDRIVIRRSGEQPSGAGDDSADSDSDS